MGRKLSETKEWWLWTERGSYIRAKAYFKINSLQFIGKKSVQLSKKGWISDQNIRSGWADDLFSTLLVKNKRVILTLTKTQSTNQFLSNSTVKENIFKDLREVMNKEKAFFTDAFIGDNLSFLRTCWCIHILLQTFREQYFL